jgi:predicted NUDIX family NTP pyrophosphohydrolase
MVTAEPGWYDDGTGKQRWWDGARWSEEYADFSSPQVELRSGAEPTGTTDEYGGIVVDGRSIRCGSLDQPIGGVVATLSTAAEISKRPALVMAARTRSLFGPRGPITSRQFARVDRRSLHLAIQSADQLWLTPVAPHDEARARQFVAWVNASADHYRYG